MHIVCPKSSLETNLGDFKSLKITTKRVCFLFMFSLMGPNVFKKKKNLMHTKAHHVSVCHTYAPVSYGLMQNFGGRSLLVDVFTM